MLVHEIYWSKCSQPIRLNAGFLKLDYLVSHSRYQPEFLDIDRYSMRVQTDKGDSGCQGCTWILVWSGMPGFRPGVL